MLRDTVQLCTAGLEFISNDSFPVLRWTDACCSIRDRRLIRRMLAVQTTEAGLPTRQSRNANIHSEPNWHWNRRWHMQGNYVLLPTSWQALEYPPGVHSIRGLFSHKGLRGTTWRAAPFQILRVARQRCPMSSIVRHEFFLLRISQSPICPLWANHPPARSKSPTVPNRAYRLHFREVQEPRAELSAGSPLRTASFRGRLFHIFVASLPCRRHLIRRCVDPAMGIISCLKCSCLSHIRDAAR